MAGGRVSHKPLRDGGSTAPPNGVAPGVGDGGAPGEEWGEQSILVHVCTWALVIFALLQGVLLRCQQKEVII